jgi:hypothetical protein
VITLLSLVAFATVWLRRHAQVIEIPLRFTLLQALRGIPKLTFFETLQPSAENEGLRLYLPIEMQFPGESLGLGCPENLEKAWENLVSPNAEDAVVGEDAGSGLMDPLVASGVVEVPVGVPGKWPKSAN